MDNSSATLSDLAGASKRVARRLLAIGENRLELLMVEAQEARCHLLRAFVLALGVAVFGLLAGVSFTLAVLILFWERSPLLAILVLTGIYGASAVGIYLRLRHQLMDWQTLPATLDQLKKDRQCLERSLT